ncbi:hypothetical protein HK101_002099, partial [Irineochytrium annulatum]
MLIRGKAVDDFEDDGSTNPKGGGLDSLLKETAGMLNSFYGPGTSEKLAASISTDLGDSDNMQPMTAADEASVASALLNITKNSKKKKPWMNKSTYGEDEEEMGYDFDE